MNFYPICFYKSISAESSKSLSKIGVIVPYVSGDTDINIYAYIPEYFGDKEIRQIKSISGDFTKINTPVNLDQIQKNISKVEKINKLNTGSYVFYNEFKKLPFILTSQNEDTVIIFHKLRTESISLEVDRNKVRKAEDDEVDKSLLYDIKPRETLNNILAIDCDIFECKNLLQYFYQVFRCIVLSSIQFSRMNIVLLNPIEYNKDLFKNIGVSVWYGSVTQICSELSNSDIIITNNLYSTFSSVCDVYKYEDGIFEKSLCSYNEVIASAIVLCNTKLRYKEQLKLLESSSNNNFNTFKDIVNKILIPDGSSIYKESPCKEEDISKIIERLEDIGGVYFSDNIELIIELVRG